MTQGEALVDGHRMSDPITRVQHDTCSTPSGISGGREGEEGGREGEEGGREEGIESADLTHTHLPSPVSEYVTRGVSSDTPQGEGGVNVCMGPGSVMLSLTD